jgi:hypothetical protein
MIKSERTDILIVRRFSNNPISIRKEAPIPKMSRILIDFTVGKATVMGRRRVKTYRVIIPGVFQMFGGANCRV